MKTTEQTRGHRHRRDTKRSTLRFTKRNTQRDTKRNTLRHTKRNTQRERTRKAERLKQNDKEKLNAENGSGRAGKTTPVSSILQLLCGLWFSNVHKI